MKNNTARNLVSVAGAFAVLAICLLAGTTFGKRIGMWIANHPRTEVRTGHYQAINSTVGRKVVLYSRANCAFSKEAREWLVLHHVKFVEQSIDNSDAALHEAKRLDAKRTPVLLIGGHVMEGFDPDVLAKVLSQEDMKFY